MNSCHEEGVRDWNRAGIEAADPALRAASIPARFRSRTPSSLAEPPVSKRSEGRNQQLRESTQSQISVQHNQGKEKKGI
eukprot:gene15894-biopygen4435